ncbi:MAG TPA: glycosyltransferase family 2 protein [Desulfopila sp.]|nr:glycosyltransferase family 2 protein [Desulfopila sp.]
MKPAIIIPAYNHGAQLAAVIAGAARLHMPIFVINDGSTDETAEILAATPGIDIIGHEINRGKGAALLSGFAAAHRAGCDAAITIDADGQHDPADAEKVLAAATHWPCLVVGSRQDMLASRNVPWTSRFGRHFSNFWVWTAGGPLIADSQSGFRLYPLPETSTLGVRARRYQFEVEVLVKARQHGIDIREAPITVVYQHGPERVSHFKPWGDFWRNSVTFTRLIFSRIFRIGR